MLNCYWPNVPNFITPQLMYLPQYLSHQMFLQSCFEFIKINNKSQNPHTSASNFHPSPKRVETFEELIEIFQSPYETLLARVSDLESRLAQVLHEHSTLQAEHESLLSRLNVLESRLQIGQHHISPKPPVYVKRPRKRDGWSSAPRMRRRLIKSASNDCC